MNIIISNIGQIAKSTFTGGFWGAVGSFLSFASGGGQFLERLFKHSFSQAWLEGIRGGNMKHGFLAGAVSVAGGEVVGQNWSKAGKIAANSVIAGTVTELGGGKFANGAITGAFSMMFNDLMHNVQENRKLREYVEAMFPNRIAKDTKVKFIFHDEEYGLTSASSVPKPKDITVSIPIGMWKSADNRLLIDCLDHELVHVDDFASGRYYKYMKTYGETKALYILDFKAYSENQWYNMNRRPEGQRLNYTSVIDFYQQKLPNDWWKIK